MRIDFTLTQEDVAHLRTLVERDEKVRTLNRKRTISTIFFVGLAVVLFMIIRKGDPAPPPAPTPIDPQLQARNLVVFGICLFLAVGSLIWIFIIAPRRQVGKFLWDNIPDLQLPQTVELADEGVVKSTSVSRVTWEWDTLRGMNKTDRLIVIRFGESQSILIPKHSIPKDQLDALRIILQERLESSGTGNIGKERP